MESRGRRVHSIEKAIRLLDCFWEADSPLSLHELEQRTGWAKSTIHGLLATMLDSAVVEQNPTDGKYRLGYHLFELGSAVRQGWSVPELCRHHLRAMARLSGDELILVACEAPQRGFHMTSETGTRLPVHASSQGKAILSAMPVYEAEALLPAADFVLGAMPQSPETAGWLRAERLALLPQDAVVVNVGRGSFLDADALARELQSGHLFGAGLDVTDPEPLPAAHPLWSLPNCILTPHVAGVSFGHLPQTEERIWRICAENLERYAAGEPLRNLVREIPL